MRMTAAFACALLVTACSPPAPEKPINPIALVAAATVAQRGITERVTVYGAAEGGAAGRTALVAPVEANVVGIDAPVGTLVSRGDVIARLASSPIAQLDLTRAENDARLASAAFERAERMRGDGLVSDAEVDMARAAARSALATRASLSARTAALVVRAPTAGFVDSVIPSVGELVPAGGLVATIARSGDLRARFGIDPVLARRLGRGARLRIIPSGGGAPFAATTLSVDPVVDPVTRLASIYALVPSEAGIGIGEALMAEVELVEAMAMLTIPYAALLDDSGQPFVFVVERGAARRRDVVTGPASGDLIAILEGLRAGESVVTSGGTAIDDGMKVRMR